MRVARPGLPLFCAHAVCSRSFPLPPLEILCRGKNQNLAETVSEIGAEVLLVTGEQQRSPGLYGRLENRLNFLRKLDAWR